jgi:hypothetical protein
LWYFHHTDDDDWLKTRISGKKSITQEALRRMFGLAGPPIAGACAKMRAA